MVEKLSQLSQWLAVVLSTTNIGIHFVFFPGFSSVQYFINLRGCMEHRECLHVRGINDNLVRDDGTVGKQS